MKTEDALYHLVHDYEGGAPSLAPRMGLAASSLQNLADPNQDGHQWTLKRFRQAVSLTGDQRPLHALCAEFSGVFVPTGRHAEKTPRELLDVLARFAAEFGDVPRAVEDARADGRITPRERDVIQAQIYEVMEAAAELMKRLDIDTTHPALRSINGGKA